MLKFQVRPPPSARNTTSFHSGVADAPSCPPLDLFVADPKFWSYSSAKSASSLAASLLSKASKFVPLLPTEGEEDDRFTLTLAVAPYWLRRPDPFPTKGKSNKNGSKGGQPVVPAELKEVVRLAGGWTVPLPPGENGQGESLNQAGEEERQFWQAVVDADLVLDFATEEDCKFLFLSERSLRD